MSAALVYAFTLGLVGLLNPCGFPLLPAYLALFLGEQDGGWTTRVVRGLAAGGSLTAGFILVFGVLGLAAGAVSTVLDPVIPWLMIACALALLVVGVLASASRMRELRLPALPFRPGTGAVTMVGFGAAYALGSLSCSLPLFLAGVSSALARGGTTGVLAFLAYGIGMGLFATGASVTAAVAGASAVRGLGRAARILPRIAGAMCALVGAYLLLYWVRDLAAPSVQLSAITVVQDVQARLAAWFSAAALPLAALLAAIIIAAFSSLAITAQKEADR
ncbi:cytochrome c biogenesis CcdA family protein [Gryllotalpicola reticulitermitis]|uniref:Cytochrome c biogenesis CcdA family protein n=1 Tax=Gryllotalpicola reticulitermitis TaxID=1184153 RepID=A0ABV8QBT5_9MICO